MVQLDGCRRRCSGEGNEDSELKGNEMLIVHWGERRQWPAPGRRCKKGVATGRREGGSDDGYQRCLLAAPDQALLPISCRLNVHAPLYAILPRSPEHTMLTTPGPWLDSLIWAPVRSAWPRVRERLKPTPVMETFRNIAAWTHPAVPEDASADVLTPAAAASGRPI